MNFIIEFIFVFEFCATVGWVLELVYRSLSEKKVKNPGFLSGCCLPIYGIGGLVLYLMCKTLNNFVFNVYFRLLGVFVVGCIVMTIIELIGGLIALKYFHIRLWDYSLEKLNYKGLICPKFTFYWGICCLFFYQYIYPFLNNLSNNIFTSNLYILLIGVYLGIFSMDLFSSLHLANAIKNYTNEIKEVINFEKLKNSAMEYIDKHTDKNPRRVFVFQNFTLNSYINEKRTSSKKAAELLKEKADDLKEDIKEKAEEIFENAEKIKDELEERLHKKKK